MSTATLRTVRTEDAAAIHAIYAPYVRDTTVSFEFEAPSLGEMQRRIAALSPRYPWLVCEEDGRVLGYAYAHEYGERAGFNWAAISSVYIADEAQGKGIGRWLYAALEDLLREQGIRSLYAWVTSPNPASDAFHLALGYEKQGHFPAIGYKFGQPTGVTHYCKTLLPAIENPPAPIPFAALDEETISRILERGQA